MSEKVLLIRDNDREIRIVLPEKIILSLPAFGDMLLACHICPGEVSGLAVVKKKEKNYLIAEIIIPRQVGSVGGTSFSDENIRQSLLLAEQEGKNLAECYCWWHSHVDAPAHFSNVDIAQILSFLIYLREMDKFRDRPSEVIGPWISLVINRKAEVAARYDLAKPAFSCWSLAVELEEGWTKKDVQRYFKENQARITQIINERVVMTEETLNTKLREEGRD